LNTLKEKFIARLFSHNTIYYANATIDVFTQISNETSCEAWEQYKSTP